MTIYRVHMRIQYVQASSKFDAKMKAFHAIAEDDSLLLAEKTQPNEPPPSDDD